MGMVRVSEEAEKRIKEMAAKEGKTFTATVDSLLASMDIASRLDKMGKWLEKRFEDLEANILAESAASSYTPRKGRRSTKVIPWPIAQDLMFDVLPDGAEEWLPGMEEAARASDNLDMGTFLIEDNILISNDAWGKAQWLKVTPRVENYLKVHEML